MSGTDDAPEPEEHDGGRKGAPGGPQGKAVQDDGVRQRECGDDTPERRVAPRRPRPAEVPPVAVPVVVPEPTGVSQTSAAGSGRPPQPSEPVASQSHLAAAEPLDGRQRLAAALWPPRVTRAQLIVAVLLFALGLGLAIQVRSTSDNGVLRGARQEDLVRILSELDARTQRLEDEKRALDAQRTELENSSNQAAEARRQTERKAQELGVLAGTVAAQGPGLMLTIRDPSGAVPADELLDALEELRAAGAEAVQINGVRATAETYFTDVTGGVQIDGQRVSPPYVFKIIGNAQDLQPALNIPGGVVQTVEKEQATVSVVASQKIVVDALRSVKQPDYARSSSQ